MVPSTESTSSVSFIGLSFIIYKYNPTKYIYGIPFDYVFNKHIEVYTIQKGDEVKVSSSNYTIKPKDELEKKNQVVQSNNTLHYLYLSQNITKDFDVKDNYIYIKRNTDIDHANLFHLEGFADYVELTKRMAFNIEEINDYKNVIIGGNKPIGLTLKGIKMIQFVQKDMVFTGINDVHKVLSYLNTENVQKVSDSINKLQDKLEIYSENYQAVIDRNMKEWKKSSEAYLKSEQGGYRRDFAIRVEQEVKEQNLPIKKQIEETEKDIQFLKETYEKFAEGYKGVQKKIEDQWNDWYSGYTVKQQYRMNEFEKSNKDFVDNWVALKQSVTKDISVLARDITNQLQQDVNQAFSVIFNTYSLQIKDMNACKTLLEDIPYIVDRIYILENAVHDIYYNKINTDFNVDEENIRSVYKPLLNPIYNVLSPADVKNISQGRENKELDKFTTYYKDLTSVATEKVERKLKEMEKSIKEVATTIVKNEIYGKVGRVEKLLKEAEPTLGKIERGMVGIIEEATEKTIDTYIKNRDITDKLDAQKWESRMTELKEHEKTIEDKIKILEEKEKRIKEIEEKEKATKIQIDTLKEEKQKLETQVSLQKFDIEDILKILEVMAKAAPKEVREEIETFGEKKNDSNRQSDDL